jgi:hypothetical protein
MVLLPSAYGDSILSGRPLRQLYPRVPYVYQLLTYRWALNPSASVERLLLDTANVRHTHIGWKGDHLGHNFRQCAYSIPFLP